MKKLVLTLTAVCALTLASFAQGAHFGIKAGANFASQKFEAEGYSLSPDGRTGFHIGGFATFMFSEKFGLQPELLYSSVGSKFSDGSDELVSKWDYITLPVMLRWQPVEILNIHAGPQFAFLASAKEEYNGNSEDIDDGKGMEVAGALGAGVDLPLGLGFTARYVFGLSNIIEDDPDFEGATIKNNVFQLSVTWRFGAGD